MIEALKLEDSSESGSVSLDDISILPHKCPELGSCDFSSSTCGYGNDAGQQLLWLFGNGKTHQPDVIVGPSEGSEVEGMYAYMDFTKNGSKLTPLIPLEDSDYHLSIGIGSKDAKVTVGRRRHKT